MSQWGADQAEVSTPAGLARFCADQLPTVYGYLLRLAGGEQGLAEDLTQETFLALTAELRKGRSERADIRWLITVARSRYLDHLRRETRRRRRLQLLGGREETVDPDDEPTRSDVLERVDALEPLHRLVLMMRYVDGAPVSEIAATIARSVPATYSLLARGREELRSRGGRS